jgi:fatty acid desaturase
MLQAGGYLTLLLVTASLAWYSAYHWALWLTIPLIFLHGTCYAFQINAVHELGHKTVFRGRRLNAVFEHLFAFLGWINHRMFWTSHLMHHRYTLHPPDDLEVVLPVKLTRVDVLKAVIVNPWASWWTLKYTARIATGRFGGEWELNLYPPAERQKRREAVAWARTLLAGHLLIAAVAVWFQWWMLLVLVTFAPMYGGWLHFLCNNTQHAGLRDNVPDYRLCCRTIRLNPVVRFLYWNMNYHTEHHMYPGVPCYRLGALHRAISQDLPPTKGLVGAWCEIAQIQARQRVDPGYRYQPSLPAQAAQAAQAMAMPAAGAG